MIRKYKIGQIIKGKSNSNYRIMESQDIFSICKDCCFNTRESRTCDEQLNLEFENKSCYLLIPYGAHFKKIEEGL